ncbi:GTPase [Azospirillum sp. INR13]|uniref:GTPase domain-containing protein n=1 Tax=Azospirillum sp. INR13 TaxID=2596919 RepID=UPI0018922F38
MFWTNIKRKKKEDQLLEDPSYLAAVLIGEAKGPLRREIAGIWRHLDWSQPSVAFYGETNAGKSTLIEALRLLFGSHGERPGEAIGDGRSDYTRDTASHPCSSDDARFNLLDVPGIEGNEAKVATEIESALHRAHIVFYVTVDARPPQSSGGDEGRTGTLEKIKRQLKPQARVWAVYNKKINNPGQIRKPIVNEGEAQSLANGENSLDGKMREVLGDHYQGHVVLSALPGFLALADDLPPDSRFAPQREKFLNRVSAEEMLAFSGVAEFGALLKREVPTQDQIAQANIRKLHPPIAKAVNHLKQEAEKQFGRPAAELRKQLKKLSPELGLIADDASKAVSRLTDEVTNSCIKNMRKKMLEEIDKGLSDDAALKKKIEDILAEEQTEITKTIKIKVRSAAENAHNSCKEALRLVEKYLRDVNAFNSEVFSLSFSHAVEVNTSSGIDWVGVTTVAVSATMLTGGVAAIIIGGFGLLLGAIRSIWKFFDSDFHKNQQKQALNKNLDAIKPKLRENVKQTLQKVEADLRKHILGVMVPLQSVEKNFEAAANSVRVAAGDLNSLAENPTRLCHYAESAS